MKETGELTARVAFSQVGAHNTRLLVVTAHIGDVGAESTELPE